MTTTDILAEHFPVPNPLRGQFLCDADGCGFVAPATAEGRHLYADHQRAMLVDAGYAIVAGLVYARNHPEEDQ